MRGTYTCGVCVVFGRRPTLTSFKVRGGEPAQLPPSWGRRADSKPHSRKQAQPCELLLWSKTFLMLPRLRLSTESGPLVVFSRQDLKFFQLHDRLSLGRSSSITGRIFVVRITIASTSTLKIALHINSSLHQPCPLRSPRAIFMELLD